MAGTRPVTIFRQLANYMSQTRIGCQGRCATLPVMPGLSQDQLDEVFFALSDQTRRGILRELAKGPATVGHLGAPFALAPATLSKHITMLERAGLIEKTRDGRHLRTRLTPGPLWDSMDWLQALRTIWNDQLDALEVLLKRERGAR